MLPEQTRGAIPERVRGTSTAPPHGVRAALNALLEESAAYAEPFMVTAAVIGLVGHPLFYFVWKYAFPQPYENLGLRLAASAVCLPVVFREAWPTAWKRWLPLYWHLALTFTMPFFFSLFMLLNHYTQAWILTVIAGTFLLTFFVHWMLALGMFALGNAAAFVVDALFDPIGLPGAPPHEVFVVYLFVLAVGSAINARLQRSREAEARLERRLRALSGQNAIMMRERNELLGRFLSNTIIARLRRYEAMYGLDAALTIITRQERRFCAMMQADIRNFTKMFDADDELRVAQLVSQCFSEITAVGQDLAVIKPVGDCIFLYSDVEHDRDDAVLNLLALACVFVESVERVNATLIPTSTGPLNFGVALHAGEVVYGNLASDTLIDPTVIGVNVNRTARMEELTKTPSVRAKLGGNAVVVSEEMAWLLRKAGANVPGLIPVDLAALGVSVRDFPGVARVYALPRDAALAYCAVARERIRSARMSQAPRLRQAEYSRHRDVEYYYEMYGSGPNLAWTIFINVSPYPSERVLGIVHAHFGHLKASLSSGGERWLALSTENAPGAYDENDVEAWVIEFIDRLTGPGTGSVRSTG